MAVLSSFATDEARVTEMLALESECAGTGIYEARLIQLYSEARRFDEGEILGKRALALDSAYEKEILASLAHLALRQNHEEQAGIHVKELLEKYPEWPQSLICAGHVIRAEHYWDAAMVLVEAANEIEVTSDGLLLMSSLHYSEGEYELALARFDDALRLDPSALRLTEYVMVGALSFKELGRMDDGLELLARHVDALPHLRDDPSINFVQEQLSGTYEEPRQRNMITSRMNFDTESIVGGESVSRPIVDPTAQRTNREIEYVFDQNKGAFFALYNRALRVNPELEGRVVIRLRILPEGRVDSCEIAESELDDERLLDMMCRRVLLFQFEELNVAEPVTASKPIDFTPN